MAICVAIPVAAKHLPWLRECVRSVRSGTLVPDRIAVHVSRGSCPANLGPTVVCASSPRRMWAGENRNRAFRLCGDAEYVSFIDADDEMLPHALQRMIALMRKENASVGLHSYFDASEQVVHRHAELRAHVHNRLPPFDLKTHHGHVTVRAAEYRPQNPDLARGQDSAFVLDMWNHNLSFVHTSERLTHYMRRRKSRVARREYPRVAAATDESSAAEGH